MLPDGDAAVSGGLLALVAASGERATERTREFFGARIRNPNTRRTYLRAVTEFCAFLDDLGDMQPPGDPAAACRRPC
ncbi:hypothetical protein [Mangrovicoccus sp. HB161399]|uniref:hypothetical protein n=1 Tax=Mangrovicoccus sp. HB161399 TaxID=2720392 RepID=UPI001553D987|nr:hypothetical protein [Mangrovicoccus sp. HB161399]